MVCMARRFKMAILPLVAQYVHILVMGNLYSPFLETQLETPLSFTLNVCRISDPFFFSYWLKVTLVNLSEVVAKCCGFGLECHIACLSRHPLGQIWIFSDGGWGELLWFVVFWGYLNPDQILHFLILYQCTLIVCYLCHPSRWIL